MEVKGKRVLYVGSFHNKPQYYAEQMGIKTIPRSRWSGTGSDVDWLVVGHDISSAAAHSVDFPHFYEKDFFHHIGRDDLAEECERKAIAHEEWKKEWQKELAAREAAWEHKRANMPSKVVTADILPDSDYRVIEGDEYDNLTADQLRWAIANGENEPVVVRDPEGRFHIVCAEYRGLPSHNYDPEERQITLYEDGSYEELEEEDEEAEEDDEEENSAA